MQTLMVLVVTLTAGAQTQVPQFRWKKGDVLDYKVVHITSVAEVVEGNKVGSDSRLQLVKRWEVVDVDAAGVATVNMSLVTMRNEQKRPNGETILFDSNDLKSSTPELREQMAQFVGKTLAVLRVDATGRVVEAKQGSAHRYEAEPPFAIILPDAGLKAGSGWARQYQVVVDPPQGTGEKYQTEQKYTCAQLDSGLATISVTTHFKNQPESLQDRIPLFQRDIQGQVVFDLNAGRHVTARFTIDRSLENHQGPGSSYRFQSQFVEELMPR